MKNKNVAFMTQAAMIAAIYVVLTYVFAPFSFGEVQIRIAEATYDPSGIYTGSDSWTFRWMYCLETFSEEQSCRYIIFGSIATLDRSIFYLSAS